MGTPSEYNSAHIKTSDFLVLLYTHSHCLKVPTDLFALKIDDHRKLLISN